MNSAHSENSNSTAADLDEEFLCHLLADTTSSQTKKEVPSPPSSPLTAANTQNEPENLYAESKTTKEERLYMLSSYEDEKENNHESDELEEGYEEEDEMATYLRHETSTTTRMHHAYSM